MVSVAVAPIRSPSEAVSEFPRLPELPQPPAAERRARPAGVDPALPFYPLNIAVLTISDTRVRAPDTSGGLLVACAPDAVADVLATFRAEGCARAAVIGEITAGASRVTLR